MYKWRNEAREQGRCLPNAGDGGTAEWSSKDKFGAVLETAAMNGAELAAYSAEADRLFRRNVTGYSAGSPLQGFSTLVGHDQSRFCGAGGRDRAGRSAFGPGFGGFPGGLALAH